VVQRAGELTEAFCLPAVIFAAHPDDEVIGLGGVLPRMKANVTVVHVTDGSPRNLRDAALAGFSNRTEYGYARRREALAALALADIPEERRLSLGITDQEASFGLKELTIRVAQLLRSLNPAVVFTHPYEGGHPDHDATAFAVHSALKLLRQQKAGTPAPLEFTSYHAGPTGMETSEFLQRTDCPPHVIALSDEERALKRSMFECFPTQKHVLDQFPISVEKLRRQPAYNFSEPPHQGMLFYEQFDWGLDGRRWRALAHEAEQLLRKSA
jgi:N-acetylglucosamine malate deacetylase 2